MQIVLFFKEKCSTLGEKKEKKPKEDQENTYKLFDFFSDIQKKIKIIAMLHVMFYKKGIKLVKYNCMKKCIEIFL